MAEHYEAIIQRTRAISKEITKVSDGSALSKRVQGTIELTATAPFRLDPNYIGGIHVIGRLIRSRWQRTLSPIFGPSR